MANFDFRLIPEELRPKESSKETKKTYTLEEARKRLAEIKEYLEASDKLDKEVYFSDEEVKKRCALYREMVELASSVKI